MTKDEFEAWVKTLTPDDKAKAEGFFYVIRRDSAGKLQTVPYSSEYKEFLEPAAKLLREAAASDRQRHAQDLPDLSARTRLLRTTTTRAISPGWIWMRLST